MNDHTNKPWALEAQSRRDAVRYEEVNLSEEGGVRYLHLGSVWVQGAMRMDDPLFIDLVYVQRMMAWMMFMNPDTVPARHAMQLGLGAGAITKFCHQVLGMRTTVVEINPLVVDACHLWFDLPPFGDRLELVLDDAADAVRDPRWHGTVDGLAVDLYDRHALAPVLDNTAFYADCRHLLTEDGCMTVNLFGHVAGFKRSLGYIAEAFGAHAVWVFKPTREGNVVVLAQRTPQRPLRKLLRARAETIEARWGLPTQDWSRLLKPMHK